MVSSPAADLVLRDGKVITLDPSLPQASAIAVTNGRISAIGSDAQIAREIGPATRVIDLKGRVAIPGFIDGHAHFTEIGEAKTILNLRNARNWDEIVAMVAAAAREAKPGEWIAGGGWHQEKWDKRPEPSNVRGFPLEESLSRVSPNNPVLLTHVSGHAGFVNRAALVRAGVTRPLLPIRLEERFCSRNTQGNPTGLLNEGAQTLARNAMARDLVKRTQAEKDAEAQRVIDLASAEILSKGITSFEDAGSPPDVIARLKARADKGLLVPRLWVMLRISNAEFASNAPKYRVIGDGDNHLTVRAIKRYMDGALGSRGAWMLEPYADLPSSSGLNVEDLKDIEQTAKIAIENGYQLCIPQSVTDQSSRLLNVFQILHIETR